MIKSLFLIAVVLLLIPFCLGLGYTRHVEEGKNNLLLNLAAGYVTALGIFELVTLPLLWLGQSLTCLVAVYGGILLLLAAWSLWSGRKRLIVIFREGMESVRRFSLCIWVELLLILGQVLFYVRYQYQNADDSFYVAAATTSLATDSIFSYNPYTGTLYDKLPSRYVLSPFYAFTAVVAKATDTHPAILAHSVFMIVFLLAAYGVYALIASKLFSGNLEKVGFFMILLTLLNIFSAYSECTAGVFLLIRLWQGKALLAGVLLPMACYLMLRIFLPEAAGEAGACEGTMADWVLLALLMCACCMVSSMGIMLGAIMAGIFGILCALRSRRIRPLLATFACCIPNLLCAGAYLLIH
jgi:hypothetical protein